MSKSINPTNPSPADPKRFTADDFERRAIFVYMCDCDQHGEDRRQAFFQAAATERDGRPCDLEMIAHLERRQLSLANQLTDALDNYAKAHRKAEELGATLDAGRSYLTEVIRERASLEVERTALTAQLVEARKMPKCVKRAWEALDGTRDDFDNAEIADAIELHYARPHPRARGKGK